LWQEYGATDRPVPETALQPIFEKVAGAPLGDLFDAWIRSPKEIDFAPTLARVGLTVERPLRPDGPSCSLGARLRSEGGRTVIAAVLRGSAAWRAGIDAGDEILGIGGIRAESSNVDAALRGRMAGDAVDIVIARDGRLLTKRAALDPPRPERVKLVAQKDAAPAAREAFASWLGRPHPAWAEEGAP
jgi:predicted metalloprotease with PDZ domain